MYRPHIRKNRNMGCHGNHAFSHSPNEFIFENGFLSYSGGPREQFDINEKCPGVQDGSN